MLYKINQRGIIKKRNKVELWLLLCIALRVIARNMHTEYGVIWTYAGWPETFCEKVGLNIFKK